MCQSCVYQILKLVLTIGDTPWKMEPDSTNCQQFPLISETTQGRYPFPFEEDRNQIYCMAGKVQSQSVLVF